MKFHRKILSIFTFTSILAFIVGCSSSSDVPVEKQGFYMGTVVTAKVYGSNAQEAAEAGMARIQAIQDKMTVKTETPDNEIRQLNEAAGSDVDVPLSSDSIFVLKAALKYSDLSKGGFDITIGPLVDRWGNFTEKSQIPSQAEIERAKELIGYHELEINEQENTARLKKAGQMIDLGGIAKGYAGDEVIKIFKSYGIESAYVNLGGNVVVLGEKPDGSPWQVGIQDPRGEDGESIGVLAVRDKTVVTSGDYERFFEHKGVRFHHILDPRTGYPAHSGLMSVTIVAESSIAADALSTAAFVLGLTEGLELVQSLEGIEAVFITEDRHIHVTSGLKNNFVFTGQGGNYQYHEEA